MKTLYLQARIQEKRDEASARRSRGFGKCKGKKIRQALARQNGFAESMLYTSEK